MYELLVQAIKQIQKAITTYLDKTPSQSIQGDRSTVKLALQNLLEAFGQIPVPEEYVAPEADLDQETIPFIEPSHNPHAKRNQDGSLINEEDIKTDIGKNDDIEDDGKSMNEIDGKDADEADERIILELAKKCHNANRDYCISLGDDSQVPFNEAPENIQLSAIDGVKKYMENPDGYNPEASHKNWMKFKEEDGWVYGKEKDAEKKTHPCIVNYDELPEEQKHKDQLFLKTIQDELEI